MPELPEVETTVRGIEPHIQDTTITNIIVRNSKLRWPVPKDICKVTKNKKIKNIRRRAKYLIIELENINLIIHLGMSGKLRVLPKETPIEKHDHIDVILDSGKCLRFTDHRRFGAFLWCKHIAEEHKLLSHLGPEPLTSKFNSKYLVKQCSNRKLPIKNFIMDNKIVVGVGNIYATEALYLSKIHPQKPSNEISSKTIDLLVKNIKKVLKAAIKAGGTTFRDFISSDGQPGYFVQKLHVYGKAGKPCAACKTILNSITLGQRTSSFCPKCQDINNS